MSEVYAQVSNLCLPPHIAIGTGANTHLEYLLDVKDAAGGVGYDGGYEITPARLFVASLALQPEHRLGLGTEDQPLYASVHQGWARGRQTIPLVGVHESLQTLGRLGAHSLPAVVFGDHARSGQDVDFTPYSFRETGVQISPEVLRNKKINLPSHYSDLWPKLRHQGVSSLTIDPFHLLRTNRYEPSHHVNRNLLFQEIRKQNIPVTRFHLAAGRSDLGTLEDRRRSLNDLDGLLKGPEALARTAMGDVLAEAYDIWKSQPQSDCAKLPVVTEVTMAGLSQHRARKAAIASSGKGKTTGLSRQDWAGYHAQIIANTRGFFRNLAK